MEKIKVLAIDSHRNGIYGQPFSVVLFEWRDDGKARRMLGIELGEEAEKDLGAAPTFVVDVDMAAAGNVEFGHNSWRGDHFTGALRKAIAEWRDAQRAEWDAELASAPGAAA
ncbi:MAG: hypothetical protein EHM35_07345 [Planctomycetaceae bacterium]|nr:MAG: hypothetical protein EHM35_07345 [Planctomycetaceae bacterium]